MIKNKIIPIIIGPTAAGKSDVAMSLATKFNYELLSADSLQFFKEMDIGTAKPFKKDRVKVQHHFIDNKKFIDYYNIDIFAKEARHKIRELFLNKKKVLIVGGSGLYLDSLVHGSIKEDPVPLEDKISFRKNISKYSTEELYHKLRIVDSKAASQIHKNNIQRIQRALEVYHFSGKKISDLQQAHKKKYFFYPLYIGICPQNRKLLYETIDNRVEQMLSLGLVTEVHTLLSKYGKHERLNKTIGYKEVVGYLEGLYSYEKMISLTKKNTRHFAKRQLTWFRRIKNIKWFTKEETKSIFRYIAMYS